MRNKASKMEGVIKRLIDFGSYFIFENSGTQTMIMIFSERHNN